MNTQLTLIASFVGLTLVVGCTKEVEIPQLAGPSTLAYSIVLTASPDTIFQDGVSSTTITIDARDGSGQALNGRPLRAEILVGGVVQDFGVLSTKAPLTGSTFRYTAPPASPLAAGQVPQTVTIAVTPTDSGDFRSELSRRVDIRLVPQGVILPSNPGLVPAFTVTPASPQAFSSASFDASTSTNGGTACLNACSYSWNFGDGTSGSGITTTHDYRTPGSFVAVLTVTDSRGAQATTAKTVTVSASTPPTASFTTSPTNPGTNQPIFFNASASRAATGRTIVSYNWDFGKGTTGSGVTTTKSYETAGTYIITLKVTDDAGAFATATQTITVGAASSNPTAVLTFSPTAPARNTSVFFDGSGSRPATTAITEYRFIWGDGTETVGTSANATHVYSVAGTYVVRLTVTDSEGRQGTISLNVPIS